MSNPAVAYRIKKLEKRYGITYTLEFGPRPFGFFRYVVFVRFLHGMPGANDIKEVLEKEPMVQFAALIKGKYDLFIYIRMHRLCSLRSMMIYTSKECCQL